MGQKRRSLVISPDTASHMTGWFLVAFGTAGLWYDLFYFHSITIPYGVLIAIGLWLLARSAHLIEESDSSKIIHEDYLRRRVLHARHVHSSPHQLTRKERYTILHLIRHSLLAIGGVAIVASLVTLFSLNPALCTLIISLASLLIITYGWWEGQMVWVTSGTLLLLCSSLSLLNLETVQISYNVRAFMIWVAVTMLFTIGVPAAWRRRIFEEQTLIKITLAVTAAGYISLIGWLAGNIPVLSWSLALLSLAVLYGAFALTAWVRHGRLSYAKHFIVISAIALAVFAYVFLLPLTITMIWFSLAGMALIAGFTLPSYSARVTGLAALGLTVLHYMLVILPSEDQYTGPFWMQERIWFGVILSTFLVIVNWWYQGLSLRRVEGLLQPVVRRGLLLFAFAIPCVVVLSVLVGAPQRIFIFALGIAGIFVASRLRMPSLTVVSLALTVLAVLQFFAFDAGTLSEGARLVSFLSFAAIVIFFAFLIEWYQNKLLRRFF